MSNRPHNDAPCLKSGQVLGVAALSAPCEPGRFAAGLKYLAKSGLASKVVLDPSKFYARYDHLFSSDSAGARAKALHDLALDPSVGGILFVRGAYGALEILPHLDFELLKKHPKTLIGFSDATALLVPLAERAGWCSIHAVTLESAFSKAEDSPEHRRSADSLVSLLQKGVRSLPEVKLSVLHGTHESDLKLERGLSGGNLSLVSSMAGMPWQPKFSGQGLFLEEVGVRPFRVHRMLLQMKYAGMLDGVRAVILGAFSDCEHPEKLGPTYQDTFKDIFGPLGIPVFAGYPAGHVPINLPVPFGISAIVRQDLNLTFP